MTTEAHHEHATPTRRRSLLLACLLVMTVTGGLAARQIRGPSLGTATGGEVPPALVSSGSGPVSLTARIDRGSVLQGSDGEVKVELVLMADEQALDAAGRVPTDLVVVLDRSGSMQGEPIAQAIASVRELMGGLDAGDRFAMVAYSSGAELVIPLSSATDASRRDWEATLQAIDARGGTNMAAALDRAAQVASGRREAGRTLRVILLSDGHANQGDHSQGGLRARAARAVAGEYVLSAVGIGEGFDEQLMSTLADAGTGNFYYVRESQTLTGVFNGEFAAARETVASALRVAVREGEGVRLLDAAGYPLERAGGEVFFRPGPLFAGQQRRIWLTLRAPTVREVEAIALGSVRLDYTRDGRAESIRLEGSLEVACVAGEDEFFAALDEVAWEQSVTIDDYNLLKSDVAQLLRSGQFAPARARIGAYRDAKAAMNAQVGSEAVSLQLETLSEFEKDVDAAAASPKVRNEVSKKYSAEAYDGRRQGAKK